MNSWRKGNASRPIPPNPAKKEHSGSSKQSWKKAKSAATATSGKYWATTSRKKTLLSNKAVRLFLALTTLIAATGFLVLYLARQDIPTPLVSIAATDYAHPWSPNGWAIEDQRRLRILGESSKFTVAVKREKAEGSWRQLIDLELKKITPGGPGGSLLPKLFGYRSLVVHLSAHGVLNGAGKPCLLFSDANPLDDQTWVELSEVLKAIGEHPAVQTGNAKVLVILDSGKQPPDFRCGLLTAGFVEEARTQIELLPYANFAVLLACDSGQTAWNAPELGGSVFGFMLATGLQGAADEFSGDGNQRVTVEELHKFLSAAMNGYVREYRGRVQQSRLVWSGGQERADDFELCYASDSSQSLATPYQSNSRIKKIEDAWSLLSQWNAATPSHVSWPRAVAVARLARAEQLLWAGSAYEAQFEDEVSRAQRALQDGPHSVWPAGVCGASLAMLRRMRGMAPDQKFSTAAPNVPSEQANMAGNTAPKDGPLGTSEEPSGATAQNTSAAAVAPSPTLPASDFASQMTAWLTFDGQAQEGQEPPKRPDTPARIAAVDFLYDWFATSPRYVSARHMARGLEWLGPIGNIQSVTREEALLRTIGDHLSVAEAWPMAAQDSLGGLWSVYLRTASACEQAIATDEFRATKTLDSLSADVLAELQIVRDEIHGCETDRDASSCTTKLRALADSAAKLAEQRQSLETAWRLRDEMAFELPTLAQWLVSPFSRLSSGEISSGWDRSRELCKQLFELQQQLTVGDVPSKRQLEEQQQALRDLMSGYSQALYRLVDASAASQRQPLGELVLSLGLRPTLYAGFKLPDRGRLHRDLEGRYRDLSSAFELKRLTAYCQAVLPEGADEQPIWRVEDLPADLSAALTPLVFTTRELGLVSSLGGAGTGTPRLRAAAAGAELRKFLIDVPSGLVAQSAATTATMNAPDAAALAAAEDKLRAYEYESQLVAQLVPADRLAAAVTPSALFQALSQQRFALWQARRALKDFWKTPLLPLPTDREFMLASAADWQTLARRITHAPPGPVLIEESRRTTVSQLARDWQQVLQNMQVEGGPFSVMSGSIVASKFPAGCSWLELAINGNRQQAAELSRSGVQRLQIEIGTGNRDQKNSAFKVATEELPEGNHELVAWFRGHESILPVPVYRRDPPLTLAWNIDAAAETTIRVNADPAPARIVFVLDCSGSIQDDLKVAKQRLLEAIMNLRAERTEIAVFVFGHSSEYADAPTLPDLREPTWNSYRPDTKRRPYDDVELILPLTALADANGLRSELVLSQLRNDLANLRPWGRTPLYEAILRADQLLQRQDGFSGLRKIVAITDGEDSVIPRDQNGKALVQGNWKVPDAFIHNVAQVKARLTEGVILEIVPFNFQSGTKSQTELRELAEHTRGSIYFANNESLAAQLSRSLSPETFETFALADGSRQLGPALPLTEKLDIPGERLPGDFEVRITTTPYRQRIFLLGGEAVELQFRRNVGLRFLPYDEGDTQQSSSPFAMSGQRYQALLLSGVPRNQPQIRLALQSTVETVQSMRPSHFVLEVRLVKPGVAEGQRVAWTSDVQWEARHRTPVLRVPLINAPAVADGWFETRLWYADQALKNDVELVPLARFREQDVQVAEGIQASAEINTEARTLRVTVTESREKEAPLLHWTVEPQPDKRIEHQFYADKIVHQFFYADPTVDSRIQLGTEVVPGLPDSRWQATEWVRVPRW